MIPTGKQLEKGGVYVILSFAMWFGYQVYEDNKLERAQDKEFYAEILAEIKDEVSHNKEELANNTHRSQKILEVLGDDMMEHVYTNTHVLVLKTPVNDGRQTVKIPIEKVDTDG